MLDENSVELTERQRHEREYHKEHARKHSAILSQPLSWDVLERPTERWWNAYWTMYAYLTKQNIKGKKVLVIGCGFGKDALRLAKMGANVYAFDLSPDSLDIARALAAREELNVIFGEMPAEKLDYESNMFDFIVARDIFHHIDIPRAMSEIQRVAKPDALLVVNEIYSHSFTNRIRYSSLVEKGLYPRMQKFVYGSDDPYITEDERKLTEEDIKLITQSMKRLEFKKYFNFLVTRVVPDTYTTFAKIDRVLLTLCKPVAHVLAGRALFAGRIVK